MGKLINMVGKHFGEWEVLEYLGGSKWLCKCSCGKIKEVIGRNLRNGTSKSCGHDTNQFIDITGQQFGDYTAIKFLGNGYWECICKCGKTRKLRGSELRNSTKTVCNCDKVNYFNDLTGKQFNEWHVIEYNGNGYYKCKCSCGEIRSVAANSLMSGGSKSCGRKMHYNQIDITGQTFGDLKVIKYEGDGFWECRCSCGNITYVMSTNLRNGSTQSCGCKRKILTKADIIRCIDRYVEEFNEKPSINDIAVVCGVHDATIRRYINELNLTHMIDISFRSKYEKCIVNYIGSIYNEGDIKINDRTVLNGKELDIYIPDLNIAIEFNGTYWHSNKFKSKLYHQQKKLDCIKKGITLINIFEYDWIDNKNQLLEYISKMINSNIANTKYTIISRDTVEVNEIYNTDDIDNIARELDMDKINIITTLDNANIDVLLRHPNIKLVNILEPDHLLIDNNTLIYDCGNAILEYKHN